MARQLQMPSNSPTIEFRSTGDYYYYLYPSPSLPWRSLLSIKALALCEWIAGDSSKKIILTNVIEEGEGFFIS